MRSKFSAFTLLELLVSISILALLIVVVIRAYTTVSLLTFRAQEQRNQMTQLLSLSQMIQTVAEQSVLDYTHYTSGFLEEHKGIVDHLYLSGASGPQELYTLSGVVYLQTLSGLSVLTESGSSLFSGIFFKVIPWEDPASLLQEETVDDIFYRVQKPGFWMSLGGKFPYVAQQFFTFRG